MLVVCCCFVRGETGEEHSREGLDGEGTVRADVWRWRQRLWGPPHGAHWARSLQGKTILIRARS